MDDHKIEEEGKERRKEDGLHSYGVSDGTGTGTERK